MASHEFGLDDDPIEYIRNRHIYMEIEKFVAPSFSRTVRVTAKDLYPRVYFLDIFETPPGVLEAGLDRAHRRQQADGLAPAFFPAVLLGLGPYLIQSDAVPGTAQNGWRKHHNLYMELYCFTLSEVIVLYDYLHLFRVLEVAAVASRVMRRFRMADCQLVERKSKHHVIPALRGLRYILSVNGLILVYKVRIESLDNEAQRLGLRMAVFRNAFVDFSWRWRLFLNSVRRGGIAHIPRDQAVNAMGALRRLETHIKVGQDALRELNELLDLEADEDDVSSSEEELDEDEHGVTRPRLVAGVDKAKVPRGWAE